ncbi:GspH/FimT family pseudopilin [Luteibacter anthropi]|uniref:GspH/FimT family pseudopilin n=1 Tax=Luteibacter anthropi TaxID=564369 RepID=UPI00203308E4|nr:GspH/FimT family pseudopilin [Luteibacter anthropi]URX61073.1 GspH/FimT family pseudopilin [Luteibacter anthropi]
MSRQDKATGFTILELMATLVIAAILLAIALPAFKSGLRRSAVANAVNSIQADTQFARGQAASQHRFVSICRSTTGTACNAAASSPFDYDAGWIVYAYDVTASGANQTYSSTASGMKILRYTPRNVGVSLRASDGNVVTFNQTGQFVTSGTRTQVSFTACARANNGDSTGSTAGLSQAGLQGSVLTLRASGSLALTVLPVGGPCTPS